MPNFDTYPIVYWFPVYALCWGLLWLAVRLNGRERWFLPLAFLLLLLLRLPSIVFNNEINPDESQMITQARTLAQDPIYFRSVDGTTGGPLDSYFLILPSWLGFPFDFITAHLTALGLVALSLWLLFMTARLWVDKRAARLALLPCIFMLGLTQNGDFLHYNSELIAICLLGGAYYLYAQQLSQRIPAVSSFVLLGFLLGMVPFGKLQGVPLAATVGLFAVLDVVTRPNLTLISKSKRIGGLVVGGLAFPLVFIGFMAINGMYNDFVTFYIQGNFKYASGGDSIQNLLNLPHFFNKGDEFKWLVWLAISLAGLWLMAVILYSRKNADTIKNAETTASYSKFDSTKRLAFLLTLLMATLYAITRTGSEYVHYLYFLIGPLMLLVAYSWSVILQYRIIKWVGIGLAGLFLTGFGIKAIGKYRQGIPINPYPTDQQGGWRLPQSDVVKVIRKYAKPGEKLVVWGWRCDYYVQAQMPQGVAENHTIRSTFTHPMLNVYQQRYVKDFMRSLPPVFVDAVGSQNLWMTDRKTQGYEIIKPLGEFVAAHYQYIGMVNDARIYVRFDRIKNDKKTIEQLNEPTITLR